MSKFKCNLCSNNCTVVLECGTPNNCVVDDGTPFWRAEITLSPNVFHLSDCPDWANYAAATPNGSIWVYENEPKYADGEYRHNGTGKFVALSSVYTDDRNGIMVQREVTPILLTDKIKPGDWIYNHLDKLYEQVIELKGNAVRTVRYFKGQRRHSDWHRDQINGYFDPDPVDVKPVPEWDVYKLVGKVVRDAKGNTELITAWNVDQKKVYMNYHAVCLQDLTGWWLDDKPCGAIVNREQDDDDI